MKKKRGVVNCTHDDMKDFCCWSWGDNEVVEHYYCPDCKAHWFRGKFYNQKEWDKWVNEEIIEPIKAETKGEVKSEHFDNFDGRPTW